MLFTIQRAVTSRVASVRAFSTTFSRSADLSKLCLIGTLTRDPEVRLTKHDREYLIYTVATQNFPPPPVDVTGERRHPPSSLHRLISFNEQANRYIQTLHKGTRVYVEANFELREPEAGTDATTHEGQRQIFLRHENLRVISYPKREEPRESYGGMDGELRESDGEMGEELRESDGEKRVEN